MTGTLSSKFLYAGFGTLDHLRRSSFQSLFANVPVRPIYTICITFLHENVVKFSSAGECTEAYSKKDIGEDLM